MNEKDLVIIDDSLDSTVELGIALVENLVDDTPGLGYAWKLANALSRAELKVRHKKALEFVEIIRDNPEIMTQQILISDTFQEGFAVAIDKYIRERNTEKREALRKVFLSFASSGDMERFELERFYGIISLMSIESLKYLSFLTGIIIPRMRISIEAEALRLSSPPTQSQSKDWWIEHLKDTETLSKHIDKWIQENYGPQTEEVQKRYNYIPETDNENKVLQEIFDALEVHKKKEKQVMAEFVSLGICAVVVEGGGGIGSGGGHAEHLLTDFGWEILEIFEKEIAKL